MVRTVSPKARATPSNPIPRLSGVFPSWAMNLAANTAEPQPPKVSQKVPKNSAISLFFNGSTLIVRFFIGKEPAAASSKTAAHDSIGARLNKFPTARNGNKGGASLAFRDFLTDKFLFDDIVNDNRAFGKETEWRGGRRLRIGVEPAGFAKKIHGII